MKLWILWGVDYNVDGQPYHTEIGRFATQELLITYRRDSGVDSDYANIEYSECTVGESNDWFNSSC